MKCMETSLENLYVDLGAQRVKKTFSSFLLKMRVSAQSSFDCTCVVVLNVLYGEAPLQPLIPIYIPLFDRKGYPFHTPSIGKWCPFHIPRLELCIPFNCCKCTHCTIFSAIKCISVSPFTFYLLPTKMSDFTTL